MARISEQYGEHVVGFIDFLGFSQLVQRMDRDPTLIDDIYAIISRLDEEEEDQGFAYPIQMGVADVSVVSDSIFFSISMDKWSKFGGGREPAWAYLTILEAVFHLQRYLSEAWHPNQGWCRGRFTAALSKRYLRSSSCTCLPP